MAEGRSVHKKTNPVGLENNVWIGLIKGIGVTYSGTKEDLIKKILKFQKYLSLLEKIRNRAKRNYQFFDILVTRW